MSEEVLMRYVLGKYIRETDFVETKPLYDHTWTTTRDIPTNRLRLIAFSPDRRVSWSMFWDERNKRPLDACLTPILKSIEAEAISLVVKLEEADRLAEIQHREWQVEQEKRRRRNDRKHVDQSISESEQHLRQIIQQWSEVRSLEQFLAEIEQSSQSLSEEEKAKVSSRLNMARKFLGTQNPLDFFLPWKTPGKRYSPLYPLPGHTSLEPLKDQES